MNMLDLREMTKFGTPLTINALSEQAQKRLRQGWTTGEGARNARGKRVEAYDTTAVCWCLLGSINRAYYNLTGRLPSYTGVYRRFWLRVETALWRRRGHRDILTANDNEKSAALPLTLLNDARYHEPAVD